MDAANINCAINGVFQMVTRKGLVFAGSKAETTDPDSYRMTTTSKPLLSRYTLADATDGLPLAPQGPLQQNLREGEAD